MGGCGRTRVSTCNRILNSSCHTLGCESFTRLLRRTPGSRTISQRQICNELRSESASDCLCTQRCTCWAVRGARLTCTFLMYCGSHHGWCPHWQLALQKSLAHSPSLSGKILVIPRADRSFTDRGRSVQEHQRAVPQVQFVGRFQVDPSLDCEHLARRLKCDILGTPLASGPRTNPWILPRC